jgi:hypothetical protein
MLHLARLAAVSAFALGLILDAAAQTAPSEAEDSRYTGLFAAASKGHHTSITEMLVNGLTPNGRDAAGRTPLLVAAFRGDIRAMELLIKGGADPNAMDRDSYDIVTILSVRSDLAGLRAALALGASAKNITSPYKGTALIAAAHLGHFEIVQELIKAGAPLEHINNLGWTAVIEAIVLGDGGENHARTLEALLQAGASPNRADRDGRTPLAMAQSRRFGRLVGILQRFGAR